MELTRQRNTWAKRQARWVNSFQEIALDFPEQVEDRDNRMFCCRSQRLDRPASISWLAMGEAAMRFDSCIVTGYRQEAERWEPSCRQR
jgi:hypothetical protein